MNKSSRPKPVSSRGHNNSLADAVAVVAGATRGAGRGIARALGEAGAIVYCTGRSSKGNPSPYKRPETIEETAALIIAAGGCAVPVRVDHTVEFEVETFFNRVEREHGRLDVLVNCVAGEDPMMGPWAPLCQTDLKNADAILRQALISHVVTAKHGARMMIKRKRGLIVEVTEGDLLIASGNIITQIVKSSQKVLATLLAAELRKDNIAVIAITPGFLRSERMLERFGVTEENWREAGKKDKNFLESESPLFVGRAVVALAQDPTIVETSGQLLSSWEVGRTYGLTDIDGRRPDWDRIEIDYSAHPPSLINAIVDAVRVQEAWLKLLSRRTQRFRATLLRNVQRPTRRD